MKRDQIVIGVIGTFIVGLVVYAIYDSCSFNKRKQQLMEECRADGKKQYECESLLGHRGSRFIPVPIFVPGR